MLESPLLSPLLPPSPGTMAEAGTVKTRRRWPWGLTPTKKPSAPSPLPPPSTSTKADVIPPLLLMQQGQPPPPQVEPIEVSDWEGLVAALSAQSGVIWVLEDLAAPLYAVAYAMQGTTSGQNVPRGDALLHVSHALVLEGHCEEGSSEAAGICKIDATAFNKAREAPTLSKAMVAAGKDPARILNIQGGKALSIRNIEFIGGYTEYPGGCVLLYEPKSRVDFENVLFSRCSSGANGGGMVIMPYDIR